MVSHLNNSLRPPPTAHLVTAVLRTARPELYPTSRDQWVTTHVLFLVLPRFHPPLQQPLSLLTVRSWLKHLLRPSLLLCPPTRVAQPSPQGSARHLFWHLFRTATVPAEMPFCLSSACASVLYPAVGSVQHQVPRLLTARVSDCHSHLEQRWHRAVATHVSCPPQKPAVQATVLPLPAGPSNLKDSKSVRL